MYELFGLVADHNILRTFHHLLSTQFIDSDAILKANFS